MFLSNLLLFPKTVEISEKERLLRTETLDRLIDLLQMNVPEITEITRINFELARIDMDTTSENRYYLIAFHSFLSISGIFRLEVPHELFWMKIIHKTDMFTAQSQLAKQLGVPISFEVESNYPDRVLELFDEPDVKKYIANMGEGQFKFFPVSQIIVFKEHLATILELNDEERNVLRKIDKTPTSLIQNPTAMGVFRKALMKEEELTKFQLDHQKESWDLEAFEFIRQAERLNNRYWDDLKDPSIYSMAYCAEARDFSLERKAIYSLYAIHEAISGILQS